MKCDGWDYLNIFTSHREPKKFKAKRKSGSIFPAKKEHSARSSLVSKREQLLVLIRILMANDSQPIPMLSCILSRAQEIWQSVGSHLCLEKRKFHSVLRSNPIESIR